MESPAAGKPGRRGRAWPRPGLAWVLALAGLALAWGPVASTASDPGPPPGPPPRPPRISVPGAAVRRTNAPVGVKAPEAGVARPGRSAGGAAGAGRVGAVGLLEDVEMPFSSTNLLASGVEARRARSREAANAEFQRQLEAGKRQRVAGLFEEAVASLSAVLTGNAPDEFQRPALMELALVAQDQNNLARVLQVFSQYLSLWPQDPNAPEILLRQGLIYRQLGMHQMAMAKFYATMTAALVVKDELFDYYKRLVLQAQTEIAETLALQNMHAEAAAAYARLLKEESPALNRGRVHYRYVQTLAAQGRLAETVGQAQQFLALQKDAEEEPEVRFLLATSLKKLNRNSEAVREILSLLQLQQSQAQEHPETLAYWQQRTGNEIANQLYQEGDFVHALDVYESLLLLSPLPEWQCPVRYQIGLAYERLEQPAKAAEAYGAIVALEGDLGPKPSPGLKATVEMARWRRDFLRWQDRASTLRRDVGTPMVGPATPVVAAGPISGTVTNSL